MKKILISILLLIATLNLSFSDGDNIIPSDMKVGESYISFVPVDITLADPEMIVVDLGYFDNASELAGGVSYTTSFLTITGARFLVTTFSPTAVGQVVFSASHYSWNQPIGGTGYATDLNDSNRTVAMPVEIILGETSIAVSSVDTKTYDTLHQITGNCSVFDATGDLASAISLSTSTLTFNTDTSILWSFNASVAGNLVLSTSHPEWDNRVNGFSRIINPYTVQQATTYKLTTSISRDATWTVTAPIIRSSSASYESVLEEALVNDQGEIAKYHIVVYDQDTSIVNYFQAGNHYYADNQTEVKAIFQRAVPDGDYTRYTYQQ